MNKYNVEYYIVHMPFGDDQLFVEADQRTADRDYDFRKVPLGEAPLYPAVYIDDENNWHDNYWFLNFYEELDCWDRKLSVIGEDDDEHESAVYQYYLDAKILDGIPEEKRLLFIMGGQMLLVSLSIILKVFVF